MIHDSLKELLDSSTRTAYKDAKITKDEAKLIEILANSLLNIESELSLIVDQLDDKITEAQIKSRIQLIARDIIPDLTKAAEKDGRISADEFAIISKVLSIIM